MKFIYSVIRFYTSRQECINYAVIVGSDRGRWAIRNCTNVERHRNFDTDKTFDHFLTCYQMTFSHERDERHEISEKWLNDLHIEMNNIIRVSKPFPIVAEDEWEASEMLANTFLYDPIIK